MSELLFLVLKKDLNINTLCIFAPSNLEGDL